ncbi:MAG TPA: hypothetical protein PKV72_00025 [Candidatus Peribacteria bacterium]|nr:hypothetical protein [Candidatus Peribacteria bacterium]
MMLRRSLAGLILCALCAPSAYAADTKPIEECRDRVTQELSSAHDIYRSVLFGSRRDNDGKFIANTGGEVDKERKGIFETRYRDTQELIWPIIESYRVLNCRNTEICETLDQSFGTDTDDSFEVHPLGCTAVTVVPYEECQFKDANLLGDVSTLTNDCVRLAKQTLAMEQGILRLAVAYDSGYRGALQFVGMTDWMMKDFPKRAFIPLRGMVNMLGKLYEIPCFMGQCDMPDNSDVQLPQGNSGNSGNPNAPQD